MNERTREGGSVAVVVAIALLLMASVTALVIDLGLLRVTRRSLAADVDAAALAGALHARALTLAAGSCSPGFEPLVRARVVEALDDQGDGAVLVGSRFDFSCSGSRYGKVTVAATDDQSLLFAPAGGNDAEAAALAQSTAEFGPVVGGARARPLPLCVENTATHDTAYGAYRAGLTATSDVWLGTTAAGTHVYKVRIDDAVFNDVCNPLGLPSPGGFLWVDFDGNDPGPNGRPCPDPADGDTADREVTNRLTDGYACTVFTHSYAGGSGSDHNCRPDLTPVWEVDGCPSGTGVGADDLKCIEGRAGCSVNHVCAATFGGGRSPETHPLLPWWTTRAADCPSIWTLLIYDQLLPETEGASTHPRFHPVGFVDVVPRWVESGGSDKYVALEFLALSEGEGVLGTPAAGAEHHRVLGVRLCGAENEDNCLA